MSNTFNVIFMGTPAFAKPALQALIDSRHKVIACYTQPPRPAGRGYEVQKSPVQQLAESHRIPVFHPVNFKSEEALNEFKELKADVAIVAAYGLILPQALLDMPKHGCINIHGSILPRWRGAAPIQRAILAGDKESGITIMQMEAGLDTGPMLLKKNLPITANITAQNLHDQLSVLGSEMILETLDMLCDGTLNPVVQPTEGVTYADKIKKEEAIIDWQQSAEMIERQIRAFNPWPGAYFMLDGKHIKAWQASVVKGTNAANPGTVLNDDFVVACGQEALKIEVLQLPGKKPMALKDFKNGHQVPVGKAITHAAL
jgi:methionyl-tRNA formyltransferase